MDSPPSFGGDDARHVTYEESRAVVLPVPYEGTVSYGGGTSEGPAAVLRASAQLEMYDEELDWCPDQAGLFTLPPVALEGLAPDEVMDAIREAALPPVRDGKLLCLLGGEHSISYGAFSALLAVRNRPFSILQIDAHADLRESYQGNRHSHASIMARAYELGLPFVQVGIRSLSQPEWKFIRRHGLEENIFWARDIAGGMDSPGWMDDVLARLGPEVYLTVDVDGLDPSIMPATGTPEPGGLGWYTLLRLLRKVTAQRRIVGLDLVELAPISGLHAPDFLAARLLYKMLGYCLQTCRPGAASAQP